MVSWLLEIVVGMFSIYFILAFGFGSPLMLWGLAAGQWLLQHRRSWLTGAVPGALQPLAVLGRWSLSFYMLHQPVFIGAILGGRALGWW